MAARRDPALDDLPARARRDRRRAPEHDADVPPASTGRRRADAGRASRRPPHPRSTPCVPGRAHRTRRPRRARSTSSASSSAPARSRRRRCCSAPGSAASSARAWRCIPTVKLAARFDEAVNVVDDVPVHQVKEFAPDLSFGGSASQPGLVALALSDHWPVMRDAVTVVARDRRVLRGDHQRGPRPGHGAARAPRSTRHVPADRPRPCPARAGSGTAGAGHARRRRDRGLPVVPRRADRALAARSRRRHRLVRGRRRRA